MDTTALEVLRAAVLTELTEGHDDLRAVVAGLSVEALDWRPLGDANSIAVLVAHTLDSERFLVRTALDRPLERDRNATFRVAGRSAAELADLISETELETRASLADLTSAHLLATVVRRSTRTGAGWLIHAPVHAREHIGQAQVTRDLWRDRAERTAPGRP